MNPAEVSTLVSEYLALVTHGAADAKVRLPNILDRLALAVTEVRLDFETTDWPDPKRTEYSEWRARAEKTFPMLGYYNIARPTSEAIGEGESMVGDAIDDIADIAGDLEEVSHRWASSEADALWHFDQSYRYHWGEHLRSLQLYLHMERVGW